MLKVLVVENNPTILKMITYHLESEGCKVEIAENGLEALVMLDKFTPEIIFTDIIMPKVSGDHLCRIIRNSAQLKDVFIAVHSSTTIEDNRHILDIDADAYIAKGPVINLKEHIHLVLDQYHSGVRRNHNIIGAENLYPREITRELLLARRHYQTIFNNVAEAVVEMDGTGQIIQANTAAHRLFKLDPLELLSTSLTSHLREPGKTMVANWLNSDHLDQDPQFTTDYNDPLVINSRLIVLNMVAVREQDEYFFIGILQDVTNQKKTEGDLARTVGEFNAVIDTIDYGVLLMDKDLRARIVNKAYRKMWYIPEQMIAENLPLGDLIRHNRDNDYYDIAPEQFDAYIEARLEEVRQGAIPPREVRRVDGKVFQYQCVELPDGGRMLTYFDITALKQTEQKLEEALTKVSNLANHDPLTGLPNLRLARERLISALALSRRKCWKAAIMFVDLDGFKDVNDSFGHETGDIILKMVADRLTGTLRETDTIARIGGDEFLVIQTEVPHRYAVANVAEKIVKCIRQPYRLNDESIEIGASVGIALYPEHGEDSSLLLKKADNAMYYTKRMGKNNYTFSPE